MNPLAVVIVNRNCLNHTKNLMKDLSMQTNRNFDIFLIDNASTERGTEEFLKQIKDGQATLLKILSNPMDVKLAYRMQKIAGQLETEILSIEKARIELVKKHGQLDEKTGNYSVPPNKMDALQKDYDGLMDVKVETNIQKIPFVCLEGLKLSPLEINSISVFLEAPEEAPIKEEVAEAKK
jgi:hypothetical protein